MPSLIERIGLKLTLSKQNIGIGLAILVLPILIYLPGLNGPFIFDDMPNIVYNSNIHIKQLSLTTLNMAAHSLHSGPLGRPLAGISFAINYYLAGGLVHTIDYKVFNLAVHIINGFLVFWLVLLITTKIPKHSLFPPASSSHQKNITIFAGICAVLWVIHPIQLTSVLYVVQRMTSMAAMFILLSIIIYIYARCALTRGETFKSLLYFFTAILAGVAGALSKETALLLPLYIGLIEFALFYDQAPWRHWRRLSRSWKISITSCLIIAFVLILIVGINFALPGYANRDFTMLERILTENRILLFYLGQILVPRLSSFGLYHDDIAISTSLVSPWTTLISIIFIIGILLFAFRYRRKFPLLAFGILWFFASHAIESTFYPLQLTHEHRNYLASLGPILIIASGIFWLEHKTQNKKIWLLIPLLMLSLGITTTVRSMQWAGLMNIYKAQTINHPESSQAWANLSITQARASMPNIAIASLQKAIQLKPDEPGYYLYLYLFAKSFAPSLIPSANHGILVHIKDKPDSSVLSNSLHRISRCLATSCKDLQHDFGQWVEEAMKYSRSPRYSYYLSCNLYAQGNFEASLRYLNQSIKESRGRYPDPIIKRIKVLLTLKRFDAAKATYAELQKSNKQYLFVSSSKMEKVQKMIMESEQHRRQPRIPRQL